MNKRYHKLERIIRIEYNLFERMFCDNVYYINHINYIDKLY